MRSPGLLFIVSFRGPRSNTRTPAPYPVCATTSTAAPIYHHFHHYCYAERNRKHSCVPCSHSCEHRAVVENPSVHTSVNTARTSACATRLEQPGLEQRMLGNKTTATKLPQQNDATP